MSKRKGIPDAYRPSVANVVRVWHAASEDDRLAGRLWYSEAHDIARECPRGPAHGAGMLAALSPMTLWDDNVAMYRDLLDGRKPRYQSAVNVAKARACLAGEHWSDVIGPRGRKTRAFAALIEDPDDAYAVCIDRHAFDIAVGRVTSDAERDLLLGRVGTYERFARVYRAAARILGVTPSTVQAATWVAWRNMKGL